MKEDGYESDLNSVHIVKDPKRVTKGDIMDGMKEFREDYLVLGREMSPSQLTVRTLVKCRGMSERKSKR
jgi:hypothetical protein